MVALLWLVSAQCPCEEEQEEIPEEVPASPPLESPYLEQYRCGVVKRLHYIPKYPLKDIASMPVTSACLRCGACLAVAEKLNETLVVAHETAYWMRRLDDDYVVELLRSLCNNGFENYGLREIDGKRVISEAYSYSTHVPSVYDGMWTKKLQDLCHYYLDEYGEARLYQTWLHGGRYPPRDMANTICRNDGIFRDCTNIPNGESLVSQSKTETLWVVCP
ncbi:marginal zone B- and B1-cell-specific protein-like isoform X2 [Periplaneta americana]